MEEALELANYLPISFKSEGEEKYIAFLWDAFETNYQADKYEFAGIAFHLLYMSFVSFALWQIRTVREHDFHKALIGFLIDHEKDLLAAETPFKFFERLKESQMFRFMRLLGCSNAEIGEFSKFVKRRNKIAHPSGTVFFNDKDTIDGELHLIMTEVANIQTHMSSVVAEVYQRFLIDSSNAEEREYGTPDEEIRVNLIHRSYVSQKDIEICASYNVSKHEAHPNFLGIESLHQVLRTTYAEPETVLSQFAELAADLKK
jgi:hypothetical protein